MRVKVSDYIATFLIEKGLTNIFTVVGGGAMHLNDSFGHNGLLHCLYHHHEQAASMAAEAFYRIAGRMGVVCVTSGPGAINALNGVAGAYQDSIPMIVISGQTKSTLTVRQSGLNLRTLGNQEFDIVSALTNMTKYAEMIMDAKKIKYCLEKAYSEALRGRPGPCWLDIPLDIQGSYIETDDLEGYDENNVSVGIDMKVIDNIVEILKNAKRPVIYAGNGIRISGDVSLLKQLARQYDVPIVTCWDSIDLVETEYRNYVGRAGIMGDRPGNFAVQNSDVLLCIGTRLNIYQVGYNVKTWARNAYVIVNDIDAEELKKPTIRVDLPIVMDAAEFMQLLIDKKKYLTHEDWMEQCNCWKKDYPVVMKKHYSDIDKVNVYAFFDTLSKLLPDRAITAVSNGSASVVGSASYYIKDNDRFIMNCGLSSMGYGLPAAIGACVANKKNSVVCIEGDGSIMMNLQELQTVVTNKLPLKIFIINNDGYHQIRQTQNNVFHSQLIGVGPESGDLGFPNFSKIASAFEMQYESIYSNCNLGNVIKKVLDMDKPIICEVFVNISQNFEPKSATKKLEDGRLVSPPLEDLAPFLPREELKKIMYIPLVDDEM